MPVFRAYRDSLNRTGQPTQNTPRLAAELDIMKRKWREAMERYLRLERKLGLKGDFDTKNLSINILSDVIKKHGGLTLIRNKIWLRGLEAEKARARANFNEFSQGRINKTNHIAASHARKTPSPPRRRRTPSPARPANNAHRRIHGIGPVNSARVTWSRNSNGKIKRFKTLSNLGMTLTNAQRNALAAMSENQAMNTIRQLARQR